MKNLLLSGLLVLMALVGWGGHTVFAQKRIDLTLKYNTATSLYEVYGRPNFTDPAFGVGAGTQITIVLPASVANNALTITSVNGGAWSDASKVYAPTADPTNDFHGIATAGDYTAFVSGQETLFFTFGITGACLPGVRLFNNTTDPPSSAAGFSGGDYKNYIGDALNAGDDVYQSNYTTPGGLCGTAPTIGFVSPADGTQTTTSPTISGTATPGASVTVGEGNTTLCTTTASSSGTWSCSNPTPFSAGPHTLTAIAGNLTGNSPVATTSFTAIGPPTVGITTPATGGTATTSPTVSGTATPNSVVTLTGPNNTTLCTTTASASGTYSCNITASPGANSVTAVACNAGGCSTPVVTNFTVVGPPSLTVAQPQPGPTTQPVSGTATPGSTVTITGPNNTTLCTTTASTSGTFSCNVTVNPGVTPVTVTACTSGGCVSQTESLTAVGPPTVGITTPATGGTATTTPTVSGTATPNSVVTLTGPNNTTLCTTTASASGSYSCNITVPVGPNSVTAVASNVGGTSTPAVASFTVVNPALFNCANTSLASTSFVAGTAQNSTLTLGLNSSAAQSLTVSVSSAGGFASVPSPYVASVTANQTSLSIPVAYNGSGSAGVYSLTVSSASSGNKCEVSATVYSPTPCISPVPGAILTSNASPVVNGTNSFTYISNTTGTSVRWFIAPSNSASPSSGTGTTTGNITFLNAGGYQVIFEETNNNQPAGCSVPATVQSTLDLYVRPQTSACASPGSSTVVVTPSTAAVAVGGNATFTMNGGQPYQNVQWQVIPSSGASPATGNGATASVTFSQEGLYRVVFTMTNAGDLTCTPVQKVSSALVAVGLNPCAPPSDVSAINATTSSGTASTGTTQTFQATGGVPGQMTWKVYPVTGVSSVSGTGNSASITFTQPGNYVVTFISTNSGIPSGCTKPMTIASNVGIAIVEIPTVGITTPATGGTATTSPTVSGTATPNSVVTLTGPNNTTLCTTTASASGTYSCNITASPGANSVTAVACNAGGCSTPVVTNFTVVGPPSLTVAQPQPGPTTQPVSGTATPGSTVTITDPNNTTLCTTTASTSGTFSCNVTVNPGVTPVTVTACTSGGCVSQTESLTAVGPPTVGITTPATGGTATTTPTVSGTATPNSVVTLTGPNNTTLCTTTASASGSYSCNITVPVGPNSVTAVACNAGGCSSPVVTSFTVAGSLQLSVRVFLQGALINSTTAGRMRDDLRSKGLIPTVEPYSGMNYTHIGGGGESITSPSVLSVTGANAIVDWVVVELRDANTPSTVIATRSALVQADGDVVSTDGVSPITFGSGVLSGPSYYVAVRHRNHLGAMTAAPVSTSATSAPVVDFTSPSTPVYQYPVGNSLRSSAPMVTLNGITALWAGNTSGDSRVIMQGPGNDPDPIFFDVISDPGNTSEFSNYVRNNVYSVSDVDLNGRVIFQGPNNEVDTIFFEVMSHPDNQVNQYVNFIIHQQIP